MNGHGIYNRQFGDYYFSRDNGPGETRHVFLEGNDLPRSWQGRTHFTIGELGFGTGLNFLATWQLFDRTADTGQRLDYVAIEGYPVRVDDMRAALLPWRGELDSYLENLCAVWPPRVPGWHRIDLDGRVKLTLIFEDVDAGLDQIEAPCGIDCWYPDGFNPANNPDMWSNKVFHAMADLSAPGASFATYTAAGFVRRGLEASGFTVKKRPGFGKKRHMLAGRFKEV